MADNVETMAYAREGGVPWHGLGTAVEGLQRSSEMIKAAELDWEVELAPLTCKGTKVPDYFGIRRKTDGTVLGVGGKRYKPIQNENMFDFMDSLVTDGIMKYETAGSLKGGRRIWIMGKMEEDWRVGEDRYETYISATTRHDAYGALQLHMHARRIVCENTLDASLREGKHILHVTHSGDVEEKLKTASKIAAITTESQRRYKQWLEEARKAKVGKLEVAAVNEAIFGSLDEATSRQRRDAMDRFQMIYDEEAGSFGENAYSLHNAVTGYFSHGIRTRVADRPMMGVLSGTSALLKIDGLRALASICELPQLALVA